jgi:hypothetical protein
MEWLLHAEVAGKFLAQLSTTMPAGSRKETRLTGGSIWANLGRSPVAIC